jgi:threonyl-tRNA synthetase
MYSPISIDGEEYYLKPMNCPFHIEIYKSEARSYRDLPIRLAEFGTVYRYELSGTLSGLARVRGFTQDDAHIFATPEQIEGEVARALKFSIYVLRAFGFNDFKPYIATKPEKKSIGSDADWERATEILKRAVESAGLEYEIDEGGGAFYGPKIDLNVRDCLGRERQLSTVQFDFNLPGRFGLQYIGRDGKPHEPFMIHRALFGSVERFTALLIEHYAGEFPLWFAPVQFGIVPIRPEHCEYCAALAKELKRKGLRVEADLEDENMREKIKRFEREKVPYILIAGDRDIEKRGFSVRSRKEGHVGFMVMNELMEKIAPDLELGTPRYLDED